MTLKRGSAVYCFAEYNKHILIVFLIREIGTRENAGDSQTVAGLPCERGMRERMEKTHRQ